MRDRELHTPIKWRIESGSVLTGGARVFANFLRTGAVVLLWVVPLEAQVIGGRVWDESTGSVLATVFVTLHDTSGERVAAGLTDGNGRYRLRAPSPGSYGLKARLIGYGDHESPAPLDVGAGAATEYDIALRAQAIPLAGIEVEAGSRCAVRPVAGLRTARAWAEARKALEVAAWAQREQVVRYLLTNYRTVVDAETERVVHEERSTSAGFATGSPYESLDPEDLAEEGYVRSADGGDWLYFAPDADALLSDAFLDRHCFELVEHESDGNLLGLAFRPVSRGGSSDIRGVLWLNRESAELDRLEFSYTDLPFPVESPLIGGEVDFERLPGGPWIVRSWQIRAPEVAVGRRDTGLNSPAGAQERFRVVRVDETGGVVERAVVTRGLAAEPGPEAPRTTLSGIVRDPTGSLAVADARVIVSGVPDTAITGADGRFRIDGLRPGRYRLRIEPPDWDAPWSPPPIPEVAVGAGSRQESEFRLAARSDVVAAWCGATSESHGVLFGRVLHPETGAPLPRAEVVVAWRRIGEMGVRTGVNSSPWEALSGMSDPDGWYRICGVPSDEVVRVRAVPGYLDREGTARRLWDPDTRLPPDARELSLGEKLRARADLGPVAAGVPAVTATARAVDATSREALVGASATLLTAGDTVLDVAITGSDGFFGVSALPGEYLVRVERAGYHPEARTVILEPGADTLPAFVLRSAVIAIEGLEVEVDRGNPGNENARESARPAHVLAGGRLAELDHAGVSFASAVASVGAGVRVKDVRSAGGGRTLPCIESSRAGPRFGRGGGQCNMVAIILDGVDTGLEGAAAQRWLRSRRLSEFESISFLTHMDAGLRYGLRAGERGALVLWTRGQGPHASRERGGG